MSAPDIFPISMMEDHITEAAPQRDRRRIDQSPAALGRMTPAEFERVERNRTLEAMPPIDNHPAYSDHGAGADAILNQIEPEAPDGIPASVEGLVEYMAKLANESVVWPGLLMLRMKHPTMTIREFTTVARLARSRLSEIMRTMATNHPELERLLYGNSTRLAGVQVRRRRREGVYYTGGAS